MHGPGLLPCEASAKYLGRTPSYRMIRRQVLAGSNRHVRIDILINDV